MVLPKMLLSSLPCPKEIKHHKESIDETNNSTINLLYIVVVEEQGVGQWRFFIRSLDISAINGSMLYNMHFSENVMKRSLFSKLLARDMVVSQMQRRSQNVHQPRHFSIISSLGSDAPQGPRIDNDNE